MIPTIEIALVAFLAGSIPFGLLVARLFNIKDLTHQGSGNIGATNVARVGGIWPGLLTLLLDAAKGALPVLAVQSDAVISQLSLQAPIEASVALSWATGFFAVSGHCFSPWLRFKGGKGVATGLGAFLVLSPVAAGAGAVAFALSFLRTRISSLSSLCGLVVVVAVHLVFKPVGVYVIWMTGIVFMIFIRHESNIDALLENRERVF